MASFFDLCNVPVINSVDHQFWKIFLWHSLILYAFNLVAIMRILLFGTTRNYSNVSSWTPLQVQVL